MPADDRPLFPDRPQLIGWTPPELPRTPRNPRPTTCHVCGKPTDDHHSYPKRLWYIDPWEGIQEPVVRICDGCVFAEAHPLSLNLWYAAEHEINAIRMAAELI